MNIDDPRITAYALNELEGSELAEVEAFVNSNEQARKTVEEIRRTVATLTASLAKIETPALTAGQREEVLAAANCGAGVSPASGQPILEYRTISRTDRKWWARRWAVGLAAGIAIAAGTAGWMMMRPVRTLVSTADPRLIVDTADLHNPDNGKSATRSGSTYQDLLRFPESWPEISGIDPKLGTAVATNLGEKTVTATPTDPSLSKFNFAQGTLDQWTKADSYGITKTGTGAMTLNGTGTIVASGGTLTLSGTNTYTGGTTISAGTLNSAASTHVYQVEDLSKQVPDFTNAPDFSLAHGVTVPNGGTLLLGGQTLNGKIELSFGNRETNLNVTSKTVLPVVPAPTTTDLNAADTKPTVTGPVATNSATPTDGEVKLLVAKQELGQKVSGSLQSAREALARGDKDFAFGELNKARTLATDGTSLLTEIEREEVTTAIRQVETAVRNGESYAVLNDNPFAKVMESPLSTFSIDVDTASYSNVRRFISQGRLPPPDAVRIEEMLNYFPYDYKKPEEKAYDPFLANVEVATCPWNTGHRLARVAIKGKEIAHDKRPVSNLVFLIDVSGSMNEPKKLPLVKEGLKLMVNELTENDRISIVVYAGNAGLVLPSTCADPKNKETILKAIDNLSAGGSTNGGEGIQLAYHMATENFIKGGTNRVLLATDGDWNVGITDQTSLTKLIEDKAKSGVFLSVLGFGFGNLKDSTMEKLADKGNGHYAYIDDLKEARKVLVEEMSGTLVTIAKDVKIQVEFNPAKVESYRLIGYENRMLRKEDFNNDKVDAGEIGAGHCVTALYEIVPAKEVPTTKPSTTQPAGVDPLKYQKHEIVQSQDLLTLKLRYKQPDGDTSKLIESPVKDSGLSYAKASDDFKFASAVAQYGMILRSSPHKGSASLAGVIELADEGKGKDEKGYRADFVELVKKTKALVK